MKTMKNSRSQPVPGPGRGGRAQHWDREKEAGLDEDPLQRRVYVGGVPYDMSHQDLYHFFNMRFGPRSYVEHAVVLEKRLEEGEGPRVNRYGFVTFTSRETVKKVLAADSKQLTLASGRSLAVGPAKRANVFYNNNYERREEGRVGARVKVQSKEKTTLKVEAQEWKESPGYVEPVPDTQSGQQESSQEGQVYHYNPQHQQYQYQQYLQYQHQLQYQQYLQYQEVNMMLPQHGYSYQDQLLLYPTYYDQSGVVWAQYPLVYPPYHHQQPEYDLQPGDLHNSRQYDDSGFYGYDVSSTSILSGEVSQSLQYEEREVAASPGLNVQKESGDSRRPGWKVESPYRGLKPFSEENLGQGKGRTGTSVTYKGDNRKVDKTDNDLGLVVKEPNNEAKEKDDVKEGRKNLGKKKVFIDKSDLQEPFKKLSI